MDLGIPMHFRNRWLPPLAGLLLCLPGAILQASTLRVAQVSGELLVPSSSAAPAPAADCEQEPCPEPAAESGDLMMPEPRPLELVTPAYPSRAQRLELDGRVVVCFTVDESGQVRSPAVVSSTDTLFNGPVLEAISASRFVPAHSEGRPVKSTACRTYRFVAR